MFKITKADEGIIRQIGRNKSATNLITKNDTPLLSLAITEADSFDEKQTTQYSRIYYLLEGKLELEIQDELYNLSAGDACYMDKGTTYIMRGTFKAVVINQPAFGI